MTWIRRHSLILVLGSLWLGLVVSGCSGEQDQTGQQAAQGQQAQQAQQAAQGQQGQQTPGQGGTGKIHDTGQEITGDPGATIATVDDEPVVLAEVNLVARYWSVARQQQQQAPIPQNQLQRQALEHLIDQRLLAREAIDEGIEVDAAAVDSMVTTWESQFQTPEEQERKLAESGVTVDQVRESFRRDRLVQTLVAETILDTIDVSESDVRAYYETNPQYFDTTRVRASHILLASTPGDPAEEREAARKQANELLNQIRGGADFAELAGQHSDCPSAERGGDLGYANRNRQMWVLPFHAAAFELAEGEVSDVVETQFGYHIIKVTERDEGKLALDEVEESLRQFLRNQKVQQAVNAYSQQLRQDADVEVKL